MDDGLDLDQCLALISIGQKKIQIPQKFIPALLTGII